MREVLVAFLAAVAMVGLATILWLRLARILESASREAAGGHPPAEGRGKGAKWER